MTLKINLALQGGGAHGAFTWGVLDRLLAEDDIEISALSGTSAGALNGAALKSGLIEGGRDGARENLEWLWTEVGQIRDLGLAEWMQSMAPPSALLGKAIEYSLPYNMADAVSRVFSPYDFGPLYQNPLCALTERFRYDRVCADEGPQLFVSATNVRTGKIKIFEGHDITPEAIQASACLPTMFRAVEIDGEAYWDGGYTGNPALFPLFDPGLPADIVVVNINPLYRGDVPETARDILNRINEISFNSSLLRELRAISFVKRLIADGKMPDHAMKDVFVHMIADDDMMRQLSVATKLVPTPSVILDLKRAGSAAADLFLADHKTKIGRQSSVDLPAML